MLIETETTPNPATLKFLPGQIVMSSGTRDFAQKEEAGSSPLATALFHIPTVSGVFFGRDFISVTVKDAVFWGEAKPEVLDVLLDHFTAQLPLFNEGGGRATAVNALHIGHQDDPADADIIDQIQDLIETRVRPAVANDGGDIVYAGYAQGQVFLKMQGACAGCPSSSATLKNGIEALLKHYVPEVETVVAV